ncbi:hypothetical protein KIV45_17715 [Janthinobacterium lividum]|nr:hypothetical protein KIV45_17715 [Janthinobacterium lividum]
MRRAAARLLHLLAMATLALGLLHAPAMAQNSNTAALENALRQLAQFQREVANMRNTVRQPLGPYPLYTQCSWCSEHAWWGLGMCTKTTTETWSQNVDFTWTRNQLDQVLARAERDAGNLGTAYAPTQAWIDSLPAFSRAFDANADRVLAVQEQIRQGIGPNDQQRQTATQALQQLSSDMERSSAQLKAGTQALAVSLQQQSAYREQIRLAIEGADRSAQEALRQIEQAAQSHHCQDGLPQKFNAIRDDFKRSIQSISAAFQQLDNSSRGAETGLAALLGAVVTSQTDMQSILDLLKAAQNDKLGSFLERLHLNAAKQQWYDLANAYTRVVREAALAQGGG